ncbi:MAG: hypothetical protein C0501_15050 [Isosphaera sp.]|nr:hypothetical protein [Isosphaera sp.]
MAFAAAVALALTAPAAAQPPFAKGRGFDRDRGPEQKPAPAGKPDPAVADQVRAIEEKLARLKEAEADLTAKLRELKGGPAKPGGPGGFGPGDFGFRFGGPGMGNWDFRGGFGPGFPFDRMDTDQLKDLMGALQKALDAKAKAGAGKDPVKDPVKPAKPAANQDEVLKRLDQLSKELDELRRSIKR